MKCHEVTVFDQFHIHTAGRRGRKAGYRSNSYVVTQLFTSVVFLYRYMAWHLFLMLDNCQIELSVLVVNMI